MKISFKKALRCVRMAVESSVYKGVRLKNTPWRLYTDLYVILVAKAPKLSDAMAFTEASVRFPLSAGTSVSVDGRIVAVFRINNRLYSVFRRFLEILEDEYGFSVEWFGASPISMVHKFTIPFKPGYEYSKYKKGWLSEI